jgi:outer membrane lipoprotein-sorting protein
MPSLPRRTVLGSLLLASLASSAASAQSPRFDLPTLASLLAQRRNTPSGEQQSRFSEERFVAGLDQPLRASGTLSFVPPARFVRQTLEPRPETLAIDGNQLTMTRSGRTRTMALDSVPEAGALLDALRGALTGDLAALQRHYEPRLDGSLVRWRLTLTPRSERLGTQIQRLLLEGEAGVLRTIELHLAGGDRSVMQIEPVAATKR